MPNERYAMRLSVNHEAEADEKRWAYEKLRRDFALGLFDALCGRDGHINTGWVTVHIEEDVKTQCFPDPSPTNLNPYAYTLRDELTITAHMTPVQYRDVVMQNVHYVEPTTPEKPEPKTFWRRLKYLLGKEGKSG